MQKSRSYINNKFVKILILILLTFIFTIALINIKTKIEIRKYNVIVEGFISIDVDSINEKMDNGDVFLVYIGRSTCPWCRRLVAPLSEIVEEMDIKLYYLNSENTDVNPKMRGFRKEHGIQYVPSILHYENKFNEIDINFVNLGFLKDELEKINFFILK